jgi:hypothetical protein
VNAFLGVKGSPVQIRPSRRRSEASSGFLGLAFWLPWEREWERNCEEGQGRTRPSASRDMQSLAGSQRCCLPQR